MPTPDHDNFYEPPLEFEFECMGLGCEEGVDIEGGWCDECANERAADLALDEAKLEGRR